MISPGSGRSTLTGALNARGEALVDVEVIGAAGRRTVTCVVDTGFTGTLVLPAAVVNRLGLHRWGASFAHLADGSRVTLDRYRGEVEWLPGRRRVRVYSTPAAAALVGTRLLTPHRLTIDYAARTVEIA